ncbi:MAG: S8 family serine peptidase [Burkholderiaceae bacterium]
MDSKIKRAHRWSLAAAAVMLAMVAACGGGGGGGTPDGGGSPTPTPTPSPDPTPVPTPSSYKVSGAISVTEPSAIDSDTNDPNQADHRSNNSFSTAQTLPNPVQVIGYVAVPGGNPPGKLGANGDLVDGYKVTLVAGQVIELEFAADPDDYDLDLTVYTPEGDLLGISDGVNQYECVRVEQAGTYVIGVETYSRTSVGGSIYQLRIGSPDASTRCSTSTGTDAHLIADRIMAVAKPNASAQAKAAAGVRLIDGGGSGGQDGLHLVRMPERAAERDSGVRAMQTLALRQKGAGSVPATRDEAIEAQTRQWRQGMGERARKLRETVDYAKLMVASGAYASATPDRLVRTQQATGWPAYPPNDREFARQRWHYEAINLPAAVEVLRGADLSGSAAPIVAVVDSGIVADHPDLANQLVAGYDMISDEDSAGDGDGPDTDPNDAARSTTSVFHGSHVAGTVAAQAGNGIGGTGIAPMAKIMPVRVLGIEGSGSLYDIVQGVRFAAGLPTERNVQPARRADVINLSLGGSGSCPNEVADVFRQVRAAGSLVVVAAGNESSSTRTSPVGVPANCDGVWSVAAVDARNQRAPYSNVGPENAIAAPGGDTSVSTTGNGLPDGIYSTMAKVQRGQREPTYGALQGTSMATPHAAGVLALMRWANPGITADQIDALLGDGTIVDDFGDAGRDGTFGHGLINARKAVEAALAARGAPVPTPAGQVQARPTSISLGSTRTEADLVLSLTGTSSERVVSVATDSNQISVAPKSAGSVDPATGLGTYRVTANRSQLGVGASAFPNVVVTLEPARTIQVPVAISRGGTDGALGTLGPVYVLVANADDPDLATVSGATVVAPTAGLYSYEVAVPGTRSIFVFAGNDLDNDGYICDSGEGCGAYPSLTSELTALNPTADVSGIDFAIWPIGGVRPGVNAAGANGSRPLVLRR